ncbi:preprotein translocase subunit SecD [Halorubraceae archaeon YAN]|nr:preprotein translocase subunit SecD [Halorubraceae archaeon YAN]
MFEKIKENYRVTLLIIICLLAAFALFSPTMAPEAGVGGEDADARQGVTNLQYGLDLAGGTRIQAPLIGMTADSVDFGGDSEADVASNVADELENIEVTDVLARQEFEDEPGTVEVVNENVTEEEFAGAMDAAGYEYGEISTGVTQQTREEAISVLEGKVNEAGLSGSTVREVASGTGEFFIMVEVPGEGRQDVIDLIQERGSVRIDIYYQDDDGEYVTETAALTQDDFQTIGTAQQDDQSGPHVPVTVRSSVAPEFEQLLVDTGVAQAGGSTCRYEESPENTDPCLLLVVDDNVVNSFGMNPGLADSMRSTEWSQSPNFILTTGDFEDAQRVAVNLRAGALPAPLNIEAGTTSFISPTQGEEFRTNSLIVGIVAVFGVAGFVFLRYREPKVAAPMVVTALSEVFILLGFAAALGYPLDLAVIAGFIAVIGTGVDDLIIIADGVMAEGDVHSRKVFDSRFRKAFWVIGAAAATTIIAMSPLAILSLGDLRGFAIFTILGVLVGVLVTRPAYGDILRYLLTDK